MKCIIKNDTLRLILKRRYDMKKRWIFLCVVLTMGLCACGQAEKNDETSNDTVQESSVSEETYPTPGIFLVFDSIKSETSVKLSIPRAALIAEFATSATKGSPP